MINEATLMRQEIDGRIDDKWRYLIKIGLLDSSVSLLAVTNRF